MPTQNITFTTQMAAGVKVFVYLQQIPPGARHDLTLAGGTQTVPLDNPGTYLVVAEVVGALGDTFSLTYKKPTGPARPLLSNFKIDSHHADARPWPGGKWSDRAVTGLEL